MEKVSSYSSDGGYDLQFVDSPPDRVVCVICHLPSRDPHMTACCGHVFCKSCLDKAKATRYASCSMCKDYDFNTFCNKQIKREVQSLYVYCTNKEKGCEWKGEVKDISTHLGSSDGCQMEEVECPNQCCMKLERQLLTYHIDTECQHRNIECPYCHDKVKQQFINAVHLEECPKLPLPCPNGCRKKKMILREDMKAHREVCPLELIHCQYHNVGCDVKMIRKRKKQHEDDKMKEHLHMTSAKLARTEDRVTNLELMVHQMMGKTVGLDPRVTASWSVQLSAMNTLRTIGSQICPVVLRMSSFNECGVDWYSGTFYSHFQGYKMCFNVDVPERYSDNDDPHISVNLYLCQGPHDSEVPWPLRAKFEVALLNQIRDSEHHSVILTYDENLPRSTIYRVCNEDDDSTPVGNNTFITRSQLFRSTETCQFIRDDCLFFRVSKL